MILAIKESQVNLFRDESVSYIVSLWDEASGGFRFSSHQPATLMATAYSVLGLESLKGLKQLTASQKERIISFFSAGVDPGGEFRDPLFKEEDILSSSHELSYFNEETTTFCQQALDALDAPAQPPRDCERWNTADKLVQYFESLSWTNPWLDSNYVMFALSQLCHDAERHNLPSLLKVVDAGLDWLDAHQCNNTGLWKGPHGVSLTNAMAATFHFTFYYGFRNRPLLHTERIIDSCLSLQQPHGLFCGNPVGQTCLDYDAIDLLAKASLVTEYRKNDIQAAMERAALELFKLQNEDGGFANCKQILQYPQGRKVRLLKKLRLSRLLPNPKYVPQDGTYSVCWHLLSCENSESNAFSTWFRLLGLRLATQHEWLNEASASEFTFRRLPFLGYHNTSSIHSSKLNQNHIEKVAAK